MVRTIRAVPFPAPVPVRPQHASSPRTPIQHARIAAWSTAIAVHVLALLLLLIPATYVAAPLPRDNATQVRWIEPAPTPPVPPPIRPVERLPPSTRAPVTRPLHTPLPAPTVQQTPAIALPAADPAPSLPAVNIETSPPPAAGVTLRYRTAPPPDYPMAALRNGEQGTVLLRVNVAADGRPTSVVVERSSGSRALDQAARQQVLRRWLFVPAEENGNAVAAIGLVPVTFLLPQ